MKWAPWPKCDFGRDGTFGRSGNAAPKFAFGVRAVAIGQDYFPFGIRGREVFTIPHLSSGVASNAGEKKHGPQVATASTFEI